MRFPSRERARTFPRERAWTFPRERACLYGDTPPHAAFCAPSPQLRCTPK